MASSGMTERDTKEAGTDDERGGGLYAGVAAAPATKRQNIRRSLPGVMIDDDVLADDDDLRWETEREFTSS